MGSFVVGRNFVIQSTVLCKAEADTYLLCEAEADTYAESVGKPSIWSCQLG